MRIFTIATVPAELMQPWLQHLRDFDVAHPECHFQIMADAPELRLAEIVERLRVEPELTVQEVFERAKGARL